MKYFTLYLNGQELKDSKETALYAGDIVPKRGLWRLTGGW
jgi:hypothetical protein